MTLDEIAIVLGGRVEGEWVRCPGPGHSASDNSLVIKILENGKLHLHSHAGDDAKACRDYVKGILGGAQKFVATAKGPTAAERTAFALKLWDQSWPPKGTLVEKYLNSRKLELPDTTELRYHDDCWFKLHNRSYPAMIALVRGIFDDRPQAVHRTFLNSYGQKVERASLGPVGMGAVKLFKFINELGVGEGIETTLSMQAIRLQLPVWSLLAAGGLERFPLFPSIRTLYVARDNDDAGRRATEALRIRYEKIQIMAHQSEGKDLNDALQEEMSSCPM